MTAYVYVGNCLDTMKWLYRCNVRPNLIFADPPFNIGRDYNNGFVDKIGSDEYAEHIAEMMADTTRMLDDNGVLALYGPDALVEIYLRHYKLLGLCRFDWIVWHYGFGENQSALTATRFTNAHTHCLFFQKSIAKHRTFNAKDILVPSRRLLLGDSRVNESKTLGYKVPGTVWGTDYDGPHWGRVPGNSKERRSEHDNQLPERLMERIIRAFSNVNDVVFDPYGGSGTTIVVAEALGRHGITCEISAKSAASITQRLEIGSVRVNAQVKTQEDKQNESGNSTAIKPEPADPASLFREYGLGDS